MSTKSDVDVDLDLDVDLPNVKNDEEKVTLTLEVDENEEEQQPDETKEVQQEVERRHTLAKEKNGDAAVMKEGMLCKRGEVFKTWKRRWFSLVAGTITYFDKKNGNVKGGIIIETIEKIRLAKATEIKKPYCFAIDTSLGRTYFIYAAGTTEMEDWIKAIQLAMETFDANHPALSKTTSTSTPKDDMQVASDNANTPPTTPMIGGGNPFEKKPEEPETVEPETVEPETVEPTVATNLETPAHTGRNPFEKSPGESERIELTESTNVDTPQPIGGNPFEPPPTESEPLTVDGVFGAETPPSSPSLLPPPTTTSPPPPPTTTSPPPPPTTTSPPPTTTTSLPPPTTTTSPTTNDSNTPPHRDQAQTKANIDQPAISDITTVQHVWERYHKAFLAKDVSTIVSLFSAQSSVTSLDHRTSKTKKTYKGLDAIKNYYILTFQLLSDLMFYTTPVVDITDAPKQIFLAWKCPSSGVISGADTFILDSHFTIVQLNNSYTTEDKSLISDPFASRT